MKSMLGSILILILIIFAYWLGVFDLFASKWALVGAVALVIVMFAVGFFVLGSPLATGAKDDKNENQ